MYRISIVLLVFGVSLVPLFAQVSSTGPDSDPTRWINYAQTYVRIPIARIGLYHLTATELQQAGVPIGTISPGALQLFHRGVEQAITVEGEADGRFDATDYVEFYGRGNDGEPDSLLYRPRNAQPHPFYSLFSDTTAYFLTWRLDGKPGKRMASYTDADDGLTPEPYHWAEELRLFTDQYPGYPAGIPPKIEYSHYEAGEGYTGVVQSKDKPYDNRFLLHQAVRSGPAPEVDFLLVGRDYTDHHVDGLTGPADETRRLFGTATFGLYDNAHLTGNLTWDDVGTDGRLVLSTVSRGDASDRYSVSYLRLRYPQRFVGNGQALSTYRLAPNAAGRSRLTVENVSAGSRYWDVTDPAAPVRIGSTDLPGNRATLVVRHTDVARTILCTGQPESVAGLVPVTFASWTDRKPTYLIVSHEVLMQPAGSEPDAVRAYAAYRASAAGGSHDTLVVTPQQLFDQFSYGERHPLAIRRFADRMLRQSNGALSYLLLLGRSRSTPGIRHHPQQATLDLVMTAGFPGSDLLFTAGLNGQPADVPAIPTGRINAGTPEEVMHYLNKVKEYERRPDALWRKNLLHLSGGSSPDEAGTFRGLMDAYRDQAVGQSLGARVTTLSKQTDNPVEPINVVKPVNEGVGLMTFFGHSGLDVTDLDIGFSSNDALGYQNRGRYPFLLVNGCAVGNFFFGRPTLTTDWVLTPDRGAIAAIAPSHLGYVNILDRYTATVYNLLTDSTQLAKSIGQIQQEAIRRVLRESPAGLDLANGQQMVLQGDPAIRLFPFETPDYAIAAGSLTILGAAGQPLTTADDSIRIRMVIENAGQYRRVPLPIQVRRMVNGQESAVFNVLLPQAIAYRDTLVIGLPNGRGTEGQNQFEVTINPTGSVTETNRDNNRAVADLTLISQKPTLIYPATGTVRTAAVRLTAQYDGSGPHVFDLELDSTARFDSPFRLAQRLTGPNTISYPVRLPDRPNVTYFWRVRLADQTGAAGGWSAGSFVYAPDSPATGLPEGQIRLAQPLLADVQQGDEVTVAAEFMNLSPYPFADSLVVRQTIYAAGLPEPQTTQWRLKAPRTGDTLRFVSRIATERLPGVNRVVLTVNPRLQAEYSFFNNTLDLPLPVQPDRLGPLLEVAFDGARIDEGAVVSAEPVIDVLVADDNRSLIRRDTLGLHLLLQRFGENSPFERLSWRTATIQPTGAGNPFRIRYPSPKLPEGVYRLLVTARDAVGNAATPYQTRFRVVNDRRLTGLTVYPNPFREQVRFAFRLTGDQLPDNVTLILADGSGRVVRHLNQATRIGLNEWTWDGRADSGEALPAGVYLYHLAVGSSGQDWLVADEVGKYQRGRIVLTR